MPTDTLQAPLASADVIALHDTLLDDPGWPKDGEPRAGQALWLWIQTNHRNNGLLWAEEDLARRTQVGEAEIAANKRAIDGFNQARNDATERIDEVLLTQLGLVDPASARTDDPVSKVSGSARLHSETAGSMIDRLSILALKIHAMAQQTQRSDVEESHRQASAVKLARLRQQRADLAGCLDALLEEVRRGTAYFKVYRQFKMYNDPAFNPALVAERSRSST